MNIGFAPVVPLWVFIFVFLLTGFSLWIELKKKNRFFFGRLIAVAIVCLSMLGLLLRPYYNIKIREGVILLTPGFKINQVDSLLKQNPHLKVVKTKNVDDVSNAELVGNDFFENNSGSIKIILGEGLPDATLETMKQKNFQFIPSKPNGIVKLFFESDVIENHEGILKGVANSNTKAYLRLIGPSGVEDSIQLEKKQNQPFTLSFWPKQKGKFMYELQLQSPGRTVSEALPVSVEEEHALNILFLQKFPTAETKGLKNFLEERNHSLTLRYQVSKETYHYEFSNTAESKIKNISLALLNTYDLLFIDVVSLHSLSQNEKTDLIAAVRNGLGVIVLLNEDPKNMHWFWPLQFITNNKDTTHLRLKNKNYTLPVLPFDVSVDQEIYPITKSHSKILSAYVLLETGKIAFTLLQETYRIKAEGNEQAYSKIWSDLISNVSRKKRLDQIKILSPFPIYENDPIEVDVFSQQPLSFQSDSVPVALEEDLSIDDFWHTKIWIDKTGWHELKTANATLSYHVFSENSWRSLRSANNSSQTRKAADGNQMVHEDSFKKEISPFIFFVLFLLSIGFLWLVPKL